MGSHREPARLLLRRHDVEGELRLFVSCVERLEFSALLLLFIEEALTKIMSGGRTSFKKVFVLFCLICFLTDLEYEAGLVRP